MPRGYIPTGKNADPKSRVDRAHKAAAAAVERRKLIQQIADQFVGEPLSAKTVTELRELLAGAK